MKKNLVFSAIMTVFFALCLVITGCEGLFNEEGFVAVASITGIPAEGDVGLLVLNGRVNPDNATNKTIVWTVQSAGTTGASIEDRNLITTAAGMVTVKATIADGKAEGNDFTQSFTITIKDNNGNKIDIWPKIRGTEWERAASSDYYYIRFSDDNFVTSFDAAIHYFSSGTEDEVEIFDISENTITLWDGSPEGDSINVVLSSDAKTLTVSNWLSKPEMNGVYVKESSEPVMLQAGSPQQWQTAIQRINNGRDNKEYVIDITANITTQGIVDDNSLTFGLVADVTVTIKGNYAITLSGNGSLLKIGNNQTVIIENLALKGHNSNNKSLVNVKNGGLIMKGSASVFDNSSEGAGGGVYIDNGSFTMQDDSSVNNNIASLGGGVYVFNGSFTMQDNSSVNNNKATNESVEYGGGGGVYVSEGNFIMQDNSSVKKNNAFDGGGVYTLGKNFIMRDNSSVNGNSASRSGGGVLIGGGTFRMAGGTVYGSNEPSDLKNTAGPGDGAVLSLNSGSAEYGMFNTSGGWEKNGDIVFPRDDTIKIVDGALN